MTVTQSIESGIYSSLATDEDLAELVELFVQEMPDRIANLIQKYESGDRSALQTVAHQIKGAAGSYGFEQITPYAARLEQSVKQNLPEETLKKEVDELVDLCRRARTGVPA